MYFKPSSRNLLPKVFFAIALFTGALSCNRQINKSEYTIGFSQCIGSDLWRKTMLNEMKMEISLHPGTDFVYADAGGNSQTQIKQVRKMLDQGIDLLIISPNEAQPLTEIVEQTYSKGIPVVVIDRKTSSSLYTAYVGADNYEIGKMAGEYLGVKLKGKLKIVEVMGLPGSSPAIERDEGFTDGLKKYPNINIVHKVYGDWIKSNAANELYKIGASLNTINAIFAHNDVMAESAREVLNKLHVKNHVELLGVDALPGLGGGLQMVNDKVLDASLVYPTGGKEAIETAFRILQKEPFARENILQSLVIDSNNVNLMNIQWNKINSQQKDIERQQALLTEQEEIYNNQQVILNIIVITLVLAIVFGGLAFFSLTENRKINKSLEAKNNEILSQRNQLIEFSAKAQAATEAKLNFFTNISHEFRTPLTLILSPLEDIMANDKLNQMAGRNLKIMHKNAYRLLRLVNQLIEYRKIEYDKKQLNASENNIVEFAKDVFDNFQHNAKKRNIKLSVVSNDNVILAWFDVNMLDKVFFNLVANAINFTPDNGSITAAFTKAADEQELIIEITDNGIGLEDHEAKHIFDQFYQAASSDSKGSGLGLSLSKEIINLHHGTIEVKSKKWKGTSFIIKLPLGSDHLREDEKTTAVINLTDISDQAKIYNTDLDNLEMPLANNLLDVPREYSLLIVEDNHELMYYLTEKFTEHFEVYMAANGNEGLNAAYEKVPDLIIADVLLPGISGKTLAEKLKSDIRTSHIPVILLTAQGSVENQISGLQTLADLYITKPFNFNFLLANVQNLIKNRLILKEHFTSDISTSEKIPASKGIDKKFLNDFAGIVEQNLANEKFNVDDICRVIGISRVQLYRKVKALLGCSISDYILNRRLKKAKYLLNNDSHTIAEVTYMVGFSNPNYFSTVFKTHYGCTPSEFRKSNINLG